MFLVTRFRAQKLAFAVGEQFFASRTRAYSFVLKCARSLALGRGACISLAALSITRAYLSLSSAAAAA